MKKNLKSKFKVGLCFAVALSVFSLGIPASAETGTSTSALVTQIQNLLLQIKNLQAQIENVNKQKTALQSELKQAVLLTKQLSLGMTSDEVTTLQEILATDPDVYPEKLVTGYYGQLTAKAVKKFQKKYGLEQVGEVGPKTRAALIKYAGNLSATTTAALPPGLAKKLKGTASTTVSGTEAKVTICHLPPGNPSNKQTISIGASAWAAHQKHGDTLGECLTSIVIPPGFKKAPIISNLLASTTASTTATISWNTNENTKSTLWYGTANPLATSTASKLENETYKTSHAVSISGLTASTTYYFIISVVDTDGDIATSSQNSFKTPS